MHSAYLMRSQSFAEQINSAHLSAKHALFIQFRCSPDVTFVKRLKEWFERYSLSIKEYFSREF